MNKTFEYRLRPNNKQKEALLAVLYESRKAYNNALAEWKTHFQTTGKYLNIYEQDRHYNKKTYPRIPAVVLDQVMKRLHKALSSFFKRRREGDKKAGFPRFKSINSWNVIEYRDSTNPLDENKKRFGAGKLCGGKIKVVLHRPLKGKHKLSRIIQRPSGWYLQCVVEQDPIAMLPTGKTIGIDMGCTYLLADSDGGVIENPKHYRTSLDSLVRVQRVLSACKKGSKRREKAKKAVSRLHERIHSRRKDSLHKAARYYVNMADIIVIENLEPQKISHLPFMAMSVLDSSWGILRKYLEYKAEEAGRQVIAVNPRYTSQDCSRCGARVQKSLSVRTHVCTHCGYIADRDTNAAKNILKAGAQPSGN